MNVRNEITKYADEINKPILSLLFDKYHLESQWLFVARCKFKRYGALSYQSHRVWYPTNEGVILYKHFNQTGKG